MMTFVVALQFDVNIQVPFGGSSGRFVVYSLELMLLLADAY